MSIPLFDAHLDLSWSALSWDRDLTLPLEEMRRVEAHMTDDDARGNATISLPEMRRGRVAVCLGTTLARAVPGADLPLPEPVTKGMANNPADQARTLPNPPRRSDLDYRNPLHAHSIARGQLAYYELLERRGHMRLIKSAADLDNHWRQWSAAPDDQPLGLIVSMEGADPITHPDELELWYDWGLRVLEPVHYGQNGYAVGTGYDGPLTDAGLALLDAMQRTGVILDVTHLSDLSMAQALDHYAGPVMASHHNCRALVPHHRQMTDEQIRRLIERDAVIGAVLDAWMLHPGWEIGKSDPETVSLDAVADHIDHVCQLAGNTRHAALGTDLDGGFGHEQTPRELNTIADMQKLAPILRDRGYSDDDIAAIFHGNWMRFFQQHLPKN